MIPAGRNLIAEGVVMARLGLVADEAFAWPTGTSRRANQMTHRSRIALIP